MTDTVTLNLMIGSKLGLPVGCAGRAVGMTSGIPVGGIVGFSDDLIVGEVVDGIDDRILLGV